jgi:hypothetical protein
MKNKILSITLLGLALAIGSANAQVYVRVGPPPVVVERPGRPPGPHHIWVAGYHRWDGRRYVWIPGTYVLRPGLTIIAGFRDIGVPHRVATLGPTAIGPANILMLVKQCREGRSALLPPVTIWHIV